MHNPSAPDDYRQQAYLWISVALAMPVFLWPVLLYLGLTPSFGVSIEQNWLIAAACLFIASMVADLLLTFQNKISHLVHTALWIVLSSSILAIVIRNADMVWLLGILFAMRSIYSAIPLWHTSAKWWHWMAWSRDSSVATAIFLWLHYWPK